MPNFEQILNDKLSAFNAKYKLQLTSEHLDIRLANASGDALKNNYKELVTQSLLDYLSDAMRMKKNEVYDFTNFSISKFVEEFDDVMQAKCNVQRIGNRPAYEGLQLDLLFDFMKENATPYSAFLPNLWGKDLMEGRMTVESMREVTSDAMGVLVGDWGADPNNMSQIAKNALKALVGAQQAMTSVREQRGWWFALRHPILNYREKKYLNDLKENIKACEVSGFDVEGFRNELMNNETLQETFENLLSHEAYDYKYAEAENIERHRKEREYQNGLVRGVEIAHARKFNSQDFEKQITEDLVNSLPDGGTLKVDKRKIIQEKTKAFLKQANNANESYSVGLNVDNAQDHIKSYTCKMFSFAFELTKDMKYNMIGRVLAAQRMVDVIMKEVSPVPLSPEILGKYADGYLLANPKEIAFTVAVGMGKMQADEETMNVISEANEAFQGLKNDRLPIKYANGGLDQKREDDLYKLSEGSLTAEDIFNMDMTNLVSSNAQLLSPINNQPSSNKEPVVPFGGGRK